MDLLDSLESQYLNVRKWHIYRHRNFGSLHFYARNCSHKLRNADCYEELKFYVFLDWGEGLFYRVKGPCTQQILILILPFFLNMYFWGICWLDMFDKPEIDLEWVLLEMCLGQIWIQIHRNTILRSDPVTQMVVPHTHCMHIKLNCCWAWYLQSTRIILWKCP